MGPSGSGKSTLLYLLGGLLRPTTGSVNHQGQNIYAMSESWRDRWRRRTLGFVFQDFHLIPDLSILANVTLPASFGSGQPGVKGRAAEMLQNLGVPTDRRSIDVLSRGERQRVAIARALVHSPQIVLADEPTASLDDASGAEVAAILRRLAGEGRTVIVATHDPLLSGTADAVLRLEHGRTAISGAGA
jgi:putative ABC transport system ATP-binding protein